MVPVLDLIRLMFWKLIRPTVVVASHNADADADNLF